MKKSIIDRRGVIINTIEIDRMEHFDLEPGEQFAPETGDIGDSWDGVKIVPKPPEPLRPPAPVLPVEKTDLEKLEDRVLHLEKLAKMGKIK